MVWIVQHSCFEVTQWRVLKCNITEFDRRWWCTARIAMQTSKRKCHGQFDQLFCAFVKHKSEFSFPRFALRWFMRVQNVAFCFVCSYANTDKTTSDAHVSDGWFHSLLANGRVRRIAQIKRPDHALSACFMNNFCNWNICKPVSTEARDKRGRSIIRAGLLFWSAAGAVWKLLILAPRWRRWYGVQYLESAAVWLLSFKL